MEMVCIVLICICKCLLTTMTPEKAAELPGAHTLQRECDRDRNTETPRFQRVTEGKAVLIPFFLRSMPFLRSSTKIKTPARLEVWLSG